MLCKEDILKNFVKFTGKHLRQSLFFNKVAGLYRTPLVAAFEPSQVTKKTATAIDHVLRLLHRAITTGIIKPDIYDHFPIFLVAEIEKRITLE